MSRPVCLRSVCRHRITPELSTGTSFLAAVWILRRFSCFLACVLVVLPGLLLIPASSCLQRVLSTRRVRRPRPSVLVEVDPAHLCALFLSMCKLFFTLCSLFPFFASFGVCPPTSLSAL
ncbi:hypothetical protein CSUI_007681 [Cystoisospora suis]|uniref:Transmembrane protein n=1 Tax=Cystoisospora suis TaxID=483139 RepID=A0A2C6KPU4_9APIC|nr:hypothetical protein CSUI_007681 [Cystoisospora suis]